jgi:hypothetical protein
VPVAVHGHLNRRVAEMSLDGFRVGTLGDEQGGAGVAQVAGPQVGQAGIAASL